MYPVNGAPVGALDASRQRGADAGPRADSDTPLEHGGRVTDSGCIVSVRVGEQSRAMGHTELELPRPHRLRRIGHEAFRKVALHAADHVVAARLAALADDAERVILHDGSTADPA